MRHFSDAIDAWCFKDTYKDKWSKTEMNKKSEHSLQKRSKRACYTLASFGLEVNKMSINFMP